MKILISGSHGLVGMALIKSLEPEGHEIFRLVRQAPNSRSEIEWSPGRYSIDLARKGCWVLLTRVSTSFFNLKRVRQSDHRFESLRKSV